MVTELSQALTLDEQAQLQERLMLLLASRVRYATQGDSSSVSQEYAQALLEAACVRAGRSAEQRVAEHIRARGLRPAENGLGGGGAGIVVRPDVSRMSRADRAELAARAERGERVTLSL